MNPRWPVFIPSKSRAATATTPRVLDGYGVPYRLVVEAAQLDEYAESFDRSKLIVLDPAFQTGYETCDDLGGTKSYGPGPARNFAWSVALAEGAAWHWVMDDNIQWFERAHQNVRTRIADGAMFWAMEEFVLRYRNVGMAGPNYSYFAKQRQPLPPFITNTRIYSCNLIRNDVPYRWRGRYNEDTILSLDMLKGGWCTVQFNAYLQFKMRTQQMAGGNTEAFYAAEGTAPKSRMLAEQHPDVASMVWKFGRAHHHVDYRPFSPMGLLRDPAYVPQPPPFRFVKVHADG